MGGIWTDRELTVIDDLKDLIEAKDLIALSSALDDHWACRGNGVFSSYILLGVVYLLNGSDGFYWNIDTDVGEIYLHFKNEVVFHPQSIFWIFTSLTKEQIEKEPKLVEKEIDTEMDSYGDNTPLPLKRNIIKRLWRTSEKRWL